jgi:prepilin-type processing-associated H-X9-DG protein
MSSEPRDWSEEAERRSEARTYADKPVLIVGGLFIGAILLFVFLNLRENARHQTCISNMKQIGQAMQLYLVDNGDRFPPTYYYSGKHLSTWVLVAGPRVNRPDVFSCPSARPDEQTQVGNPVIGWKGKTIELSYGMFLAMSTADKNALDNPGATALIAETIAGGHFASYDPDPIAGGNDGFSIDFDKKGTKMTRLAVSLRDESKGWVPGNTVPRHVNRGVVVLFVDGHAETLGPDLMFLNTMGPIRPDLWAVPRRER